jgi:hypothetical protein
LTESGFCQVVIRLSGTFSVYVASTCSSPAALAEIRKIIAGSKIDKNLALADT